MYLCEFIVPEREHFVEAIRYIPRPPLLVRGAMNPWELERTRERWMAEEKAWKDIQAAQIRYRALRVTGERTLNQFNQKLAELENLTGKKSGMLSASNLATFVASSSGNPYIMAALAVKMLVDIFMGNKKKKKIEATIRDLERLQAELMALYREMEQIAGQVVQWANVGESIRAQQQATMTVVAQSSEEAYARRQSLERERGKAHRAMAEMVAHRPRPQGDYDVL